MLLNLTAILAGRRSVWGGTSRDVADAVTTFFNDGGTLPPEFVTLFGLTGGNLANALSQLSGEAATGGQQVAFQMTTSSSG